MKRNEITALADSVYEYLKENHCGVSNGITRPELAKRLNLTTRILRRITKEINTNTKYKRLVSTTHCCYVCETKKECEKTIKNTYRVALSLLKKAREMEKKVELNGQFVVCETPNGFDICTVDTYVTDERI